MDVISESVGENLAHVAYAAPPAKSIPTIGPIKRVPTSAPAKAAPARVLLTDMFTEDWVSSALTDPVEVSSGTMTSMNEPGKAFSGTITVNTLPVSGVTINVSPAISPRGIWSLIAWLTTLDAVTMGMSIFQK